MELRVWHEVGIEPFLTVMLTEYSIERRRWREGDVVAAV